MKLQQGILFAILLAAVPTLAQSPSSGQEVSLCHLRQNASQFDHKVVTVRGTIDLEFESFTLYDPQCKDTTSTSVWVTFGGDVSDVAVYCCGDHSRDPGKDLLVDGKPIALVKDTAYDELDKLMQASRNRMPDGKPCQDCHFYRVSATLTGLFLAEKNSEKEHVGYGHLGCCSLLIIENVSDVSAEKTDVPLGTFDCEKSTWKATSNDLTELEPYVQCTSTCDEQTDSLLKQVASHWGDPVVVAGGSTNGSFSDTSGPHPVDHLNWISKDMLTSYAMLADETKPPTLSVARQVCRPKSAQPTLRKSISCDEYSMAADWGPDRQREYERLIHVDKFVLAEKMIADSAEKLSSAGDQSWRTEPLSTAANAIFLKGVESWAVSVDPNLKTDPCSEPPSMEEQQYSYVSCSWYSPDGMQEFEVNLMHRKPGSTDLVASPWLLASATARICR